MRQPQMVPKLSINGICPHRQPTEEANEATVCATCAGYQLFQRAIVDQAADAWHELYQIYSPVVFSWVLNHPCFWKMGEDASYFVNRAFEKLWLALPPDKFAHFPDLPSLLKYWQTCVHSVIIDHARKANQHVPTLSFDHDEQFEVEDTVQAVERALEEMAQAEVWAHIQQRLSERENQVIYYRFIYGLKPRHICEQFPEEFPNVDEIYTILQNALGRLRRDPELKQYWAAWIMW